MTGPATCPQADFGSDNRVDLDQLYRRERPALVRFFARDRSAGHDAEDLAQEAFLRMARADRPDSAIAKPAGYLRHIGRNLLKDRARAAETRYMDTGAGIDHAISEVNELGRLEARDSLRRLEAAMLRIKPRSRDIFLAHRLDGLSYGEIAEQTGLSVKRVEKIMSKTIAALTRLMEHDA